MLNPKNLLKVLDQREEDSKRLDKILENMKLKNFVLYFDNYAMSYDTEFNVFQAGSHEVNTNVFKDGREAIDYCLYNDEWEALEKAENLTEEKND